MTEARYYFLIEAGYQLLYTTADFFLQTSYIFGSKWWDFGTQYANVILHVTFTHVQRTWATKINFSSPQLPN